MALALIDLGRLSVTPSKRIEFENGPLGTRGVADFAKTVWESDLINATMLWGNGCYTTGPDGTWEPEIRLMMLTDDGAKLFVHYWVRVNREKMMNKEVEGPFLAGRIETVAPQYRWLNDTHIVGEGFFTTQFDEHGEFSAGDVVMAYNMFALSRS